MGAAWGKPARCYPGTASYATSCTCLVLVLLPDQGRGRALPCGTWSPCVPLNQSDVSHPPPDLARTEIRYLPHHGLTLLQRLGSPLSPSTPRATRGRRRVAAARNPAVVLRRPSRRRHEPPTRGRAAQIPHQTAPRPAATPLRLVGHGPGLTGGPCARGDPSPTANRRRSATRRRGPTSPFSLELPMNFSSAVAGPSPRARRLGRQLWRSSRRRRSDVAHGGRTASARALGDREARTRRRRPRWRCVPHRPRSATSSVDSPSAATITVPSRRPAPGDPSRRGPGGRSGRGCTRCTHPSRPRR